MKIVNNVFKIFKIMILEMITMAYNNLIFVPSFILPALNLLYRYNSGLTLFGDFSGNYVTVTSLIFGVWVNIHYLAKHEKQIRAPYDRINGEAKQLYDSLFRTI